MDYPEMQITHDGKTLKKYDKVYIATYNDGVNIYKAKVTDITTDTMFGTMVWIHTHDEEIHLISALCSTKASAVAKLLDDTHDNLDRAKKTVSMYTDITAEIFKKLKEIEK
jgi:hypothetical protein